MKQASKEDMALLLRAIARGDLKRDAQISGAEFTTHPYDRVLVGAYVPEKGAIPCLLDATRKWLKKKEKSL